MGKLYIVSTPIGNMKDISLRALEVLFSVDVILCEDTRKSGMLLEHYKEYSNDPDKKPGLMSFYQGNEDRKMNHIIELLKEGKDVALISNSGTPLLSDPGFKLVRECVREKIEVIPIPGASALLAGLVVSGLPMDKFLFLGFLPKKQGKKRKVLEDLKGKNMTTIFYESPFRIKKTLEMIDELLPESNIVIARELTKKFEETMRGTAKELIAKLGDKKVKGELTVVMN